MKIDYIEIEFFRNAEGIEDFYVYFIKDNRKEIVDDDYYRNIIYKVAREFNARQNGYSLIYSQTSEILNAVKQEIEKKNGKKLARCKDKKVNRNKSKNLKNWQPLLAAMALLVVINLGIDHIKSSKEVVTNEISSSYYEPHYSDLTGMIIDENDIMEYKYYYDGETNKESMDVASQYKDIFEKYGKMYGISPRLLQAICAQENSGEHVVDYNKPAIGAMGIELSAWLNQKVKVYNFDKKEMEEITITQEMLENVDSNIMVGAAILQANFNATMRYGVNEGKLTRDDALGYALHRYNKGGENMSRALNADGYWKNNIYFANGGDYKYAEHVMSKLDKNEVLEFLYYDGETGKTYTFYWGPTNSNYKNISLS